MTATYRAFQLFKWLVYALLALNIVWFFNVEWAAAAHRFGSDLTAADFIEAFAATIDTSAWVVLLLLFELETYVLEDRQITATVATALFTLRAVCFCLIAYSLSGYVVRLQFTDSAVLLDRSSGLCRLAADGWSYMEELDRFTLLSTDNCQLLGQNGALFQMGSANLAVDNAGLTSIRRLAWLDVLNAIAWLCVVVVLEIDVRLQERHRLHGLALKASTATKLFLYAVLFAAAVYWGLRGTFINFWDAFLWLIAFFFIEMNVIEWRQETEAEDAALTAST